MRHLLAESINESSASNDAERLVIGGECYNSCYFAFKYSPLHSEFPEGYSRADVGYSPNANRDRQQHQVQLDDHSPSVKELHNHFSALDLDNSSAIHEPLHSPQVPSACSADGASSDPMTAGNLQNQENLDDDHHRAAQDPRFDGLPEITPNQDVQHEIPNPAEQEFLSNSAHEFWTWSVDHQNWFHFDKLTDCVVWAPLDFD